MMFMYWTGEKETDGDTRPAHGAREWADSFENFRLFNDDDVLEILRAFDPGLANLFPRIRLPACRSDIARLVLLHESGGLFLDAHCGVGAKPGLIEVLDSLSRHELVLFDKQEPGVQADQINLINSVMAARKGAPLLARVIERVIRNLFNHHASESATTDYLPYNLAVVTGAWNLMLEFFELAAPVRLKADLADRVRVMSLSQDRNYGFTLYAKYGYRMPGQHWSERQSRERLFD